MVSSNLFVFYLIFVIQVYHKLIAGEKVGLPPLKGEVSKVDNFNCQLLTEGSEQPTNLIFRFYRHNELIYFPVKLSLH